MGYSKDKQRWSSSSSYSSGRVERTTSRAAGYGQGGGAYGAAGDGQGGGADIDALVEVAADDVEEAPAEVPAALGEIDGGGHGGRDGGH